MRLLQSIISETNHLWGSPFLQSIQNLMKISRMQKTIQKKIFDFWIIAFELIALNTCFYWERTHFIGCQYVDKQSQDLRYYYDRFFSADFLSYWPKNTTKTLASWFKQCFGTLNMLTAHKCYDTGLFRHLSNPAFFSL